MYTPMSKTPLDVSEKRNIQVDKLKNILICQNTVRHFAIYLPTSPRLTEFQCIGSGNLSVFTPFDKQSYRTHNIHSIWIATRCVSLSRNTRAEYTTRNRNLTARSSEFLNDVPCFSNCIDSVLLAT